MLTITGKTINKAIAESFANSARKLHRNENRSLSFDHYKLTIFLIDDENNNPTYHVELVDIQTNTIEFIDCSTSPENIRHDVLNILSDKCSLTGISLSDMKTAMSNIVDIKCFLYLKTFFENDCDNDYKTNAIHRYAPKYADITEDNILSVTELVLDDIRKKTHTSYKNTPALALANVGLNYDDFEEDVFGHDTAHYHHELPEWSIYGQHRRYMDEVELPAICNKLLDALSDIFVPSENVYDVMSYDLSNYTFSCDSIEMVDFFGELLDVYTVFEGEDELYSI